MTGLSLSLHALAAVIWVGGMFFAYMAMRPAVVRVVDPSQRPLLWCHALSLFFRWVWAAVGILLVTGYGLIHAYGGMGSVNWHIHMMHGLGLLMMLLFLHIFFAPYKRLKQAVDSGDIEEGKRRVGQIRMFVAINLVIGLIVVVIATGGRYW
ncbi:CopD family protein [Halospina sp. K52047b]|uniref:CopD family protein n=1 Tax=Halospina sp. K52047b TaxID=2614160 RepID=UPI00124A3AF9|nr:CopD family protein [Halospina sp. K52047b]KAA8980318.1 hypothetical protein F3089_11680 [Halospina sp. K52047b]